MKKILQLWGETQVGKTSLLSAALFAHPAELPWIDRQHSTGILSELQQHWQTLRKNRLASGTVRDLVEIPLRVKIDIPNNPAGLQEILLRDMKGGNVQQLSQPEIQQQLREADGLLCVVAWDSQDMMRQLHAVADMCVYFPDKPIFLAISKAEMALHPSWDAEAWSGRPGWWEQFRPWKDHPDVLRYFSPEAIWPCSVFGYDRHHPDRPACLLGEYGQLIPYNIQPRNVCRPLAWFFEQWSQS